MQNEEHIICINDEIEVDYVLEEKEINTSLQTKVNTVSTKCDEKKIKHILQQLQTQRKMASS